MQYTVGIEIETTDLPENYWRELIKLSGVNWRVETDGSIRTNRARIPGVRDFELVPMGPEERFGAELISPIIYVNHTMWSEVEKVMELLKESGELAKANSSIHVHVGRKGGYGRSVINYIPYFKEVDKLFFDVSAPRGQHPRGIYNSFIYYRPLESPQWADDGYDVFRPSLGNLDQCTDLEEVKFCLGRRDLNPPKWYPARYCGINLVSLFDHGTIEFRHFNFTSSLLQLKAWVYLCLGVIKSADDGSFITNVEKLIRKGSIEDNISKLVNVLNFSDVYNLIDMGAYRTHTNRSIYWGRGEIYQSLIPERSLKRTINVRNAHPENTIESKDYFPPIFLGEGF